MKKVLTWGAVIAGLLLLAGCGQKQADTTANKHATHTSQTKTAKSSQSAKPQTATDKLLTQVSAKVPEDSGSRTNNGEVTYSQFYQKQNHWYWRLTSAARGTIAQGEVQSLKNDESGMSKQLTLTDQGTTYTLNFQWFDELHQGYRVHTKHLNIDGSYVLCDAQVPGNWTKGAPDGLTGTWETDLYPSTTDAKTYPYTKTRYIISDDSKVGFNDGYNAAKKRKLDGAGWNANNNLQYKKLSTNVYMLKSYNGYPDLTKVKFANNQLTIDYQATGKYAFPAMHRVGDAPTQNTESTTSSSSSSVDTTNLTTAQVKDWVWRHYSKKVSSKFTRADYFMELDTDDEGVLTITVRENHDTANMRKAGVAREVAPAVAWYEIDSKGRLMDGVITGHPRVVANNFNE